MTVEPLETDTGAEPPPRPRSVPWWAAVLDAATLITVCLLISNVVFDGFRLRLGAFRLTATSAWRIALMLLVLAGVRHALVRSPAIWDRVAGWAVALWRAPARRVILPALLSSRGLVLGVGLLSVSMIGYPPGAPPYRISRDELANLPMRWDAGWYMGIAVDGYKYQGYLPGRQQNIAFFPAYPLVTRAVASLLGMRSTSLDAERGRNRVEFEFFQHRRVLIAGTLVSIAAFGWALVYLFRLARDLLDGDAAAGAVLIACAYPFALFFSAVYTESLFLLGVVGAFAHFHRRQYLLAGVWGLLAGLTRPNGCLLSVPLAILACREIWPAWGGASDVRIGSLASARRVMPALASASAPGIGMLLFTWYIYELTGRWFAWMEAHAAWGRVYQGVSALLAERTSFIVEYGVYNYSMQEPVELVNAVPTLVALALAVPIAWRLGLAYAVFIPAMILPPLFAGGFLSLGRLTSTLFPLFIFLAWLCRGPSRWAMVLLFAGLQAFLAVLFYTWRPLF
jgi:hypothetical protein